MQAASVIEAYRQSALQLRRLASTMSSTSRQTILAVAEEYERTAAYLEQARPSGRPPPPRRVDKYTSSQL